MSVASQQSEVLPFLAQSVYSRFCTIDHFYWLAKYTHDPSILESDKQLKQPFIVRSNVENEGYLSTLLPLLFNSTYSLIVDSYDLYNSVPSPDWIDSALMAIAQNPSTVPVCGLYPNSMVARGCMLLKTSDLRHIWTRTSFRRQPVAAMEVFSHILRCKFHYTLVSSASLKLRESSYQPSAFVTSQCEKVYNVRDFTCEANYTRDKSIGVVLPQFKRTWLKRQLESLMSGTQKPRQMIVLQDAQHQNYQPLLRAYPIAKHIWTTNWDSPFFLRFLVPLLLTTYYVHNIDDDIIFGNTTVQTLNGMIDEYKSLVAVYGRTLTHSDYKSGVFQQKGAEQKEHYLHGDWLVNTYGGVIETVKVFWRYSPYTQRNGEDIHYSLSNNVECDGPVRILDTTKSKNRIESHGSDAVATYLSGGHFEIRGKIVRSWIVKGASFINVQKALFNYPAGTKNFSSYYREHSTY